MIDMQIQLLWNLQILNFLVLLKLTSGQFKIKLSYLLL
jgi:hypothetical protein